MLCQTAEDEGEQLAGEAGVSHSLLPDNAPSGDRGELGGGGVGAAAVADSLPAWGANTHAGRLTRKNGMRREMGAGGGRGADIIHSNTARLELVQR